MTVYLLCFRPPNRDYTEIIIASSSIKKIEERMRETFKWALSRYADWSEYDMEETLKDFKDDYGCTFDECIKEHTVDYRGISLYIEEKEVVN